jgi:hypothetical protein
MIFGASGDQMNSIRRGSPDPVPNDTRKWRFRAIEKLSGFAERYDAMQNI